LLWRIRMRVVAGTIKAERAREGASGRAKERERERTTKGQLTGLKDKLTKRSQQTKPLHKTVETLDRRTSEQKETRANL